MTRERRRVVLAWMLIDATCTLVSFFLALSIATRNPSSVLTDGACYPVLVVLLGVTIATAWSLRLYSVQPRYVGFQEAGKLVVLCGMSTLAFSIATPVYLNRWSLDPLLAPSLYCIASGFSFCSVRLAWRAAEFRKAREMRARGKSHSSRTLLVGAGDAAETVVRELKRGHAHSHQVVAVVDDDPKKSQTHLHGVPVLGTTRDIPELVERLAIEEILIAIPSADGARMREIFGICADCGVRTKTLPAVSDVMAGKTYLNQMRDIDIADLIRKTPVPTDSSVGEAYLRGEVVLITGGGGSIGGELARQVARLEPAQLILVGKGENSIFEIEQDLIYSGHVPPVAVIADVRDRSAMEAIFRKYRPSTVFHAAAHKHVPLMQGNAIEAIKNNVFGTSNVVELAVTCGAKKFILVSTDKAVNPTNVMGATKRIAELIVRYHATRSDIQAAIVRFGNVLGSRGSLIPCLKSQILRGGPVRVTHPEMTRFFMTIPEAVQLIIQAGAIGKLAETFILDMGEPMRILDVVYDVIRLHGFEPNVTMPVVLSGPRPGEKMHEELTDRLESLVPTSHPRISAAVSDAEPDWEGLVNGLRRLKAFCDTGDSEGAHSLLMALATGMPSLALINDSWVKDATKVQ